MEDYAAKMQDKTAAELREYVSGYAQYREDAVLAAFEELRRRGQPAPEEAALRPALEAALATQRSAAAIAEAARPSAVATAEAGDDVPKLYSITSILIFSVLPTSTMLTGGILLGINMFRLGKKWAVLGLALFMIAYFLLVSVALTWAMGQFALTPITVIMLFNVPAALAYVLWFWPRYVGGTAYRSRSVLLPVLVLLLVFYGLRQITPYLIKQLPPETRKELERMQPPQQQGAEVL